MKNIKAAIEGDELVLRVNLKERHGKSSTGKTTIVASSEGVKPVDGHPDIKFNLTAFTK